MYKTQPVSLLTREKQLRFGAKLKAKQAQFHPGTRQWAFEALREWLADPSSPKKLFWLQGSAGTGKTAWSAEVVRRHGKQLAALHMCLHSDTSLNDPAKMLLSIAAQLCRTVDGFQEQLQQAHPPDRLYDLIAHTTALVDLFDGLRAVGPHDGDAAVGRVRAPPHSSTIQI